MSRRGEIVIECESQDCAATVKFCPDDLDGCDVSQRLSDEHWRVIEGRDACFSCAQEVALGKRCRGCLCAKDGDPCYCEINGRERGDDDGQEYGHPGDELRGL